MVTLFTELCLIQHNDFWGAELGASPSFSWRSILEAKSILKTGVRWQVGNGERINIWSDAWLPGTFPRCATSPQREDAPQLVADLIDFERGTWRLDVLERHFSPADIDSILSIPISQRFPQNRLVWHFHKKGLFTTNSAYFVVRSLALGEVPSSISVNIGYQKLWNAIWGAKVPGKVAIIVWRACENILPVRERLVAKGYQGDMSCLLCPHNSESIHHVFCECPYARAILVAPPMQLNILPDSSFKEWLLGCANTLPKAQFEKLMMFIWAIWKSRNAQLWDMKHPHPSEVIFLTMGWYEEFMKANTSTSTPSTVHAQWEKPIVGVLKYNIDGAFELVSKRSGAGAVFRDNNGAFVAGFSRSLDLISSPFQSELMALHHAIKLAKDLQYDKVLFETDCLLLVQALRAPVVDQSILGFIVEDVRLLLMENQDYQISYVNRRANGVAHILARLTLFSNVNQTWFGRAPNFIRDVILNDCNR